MQTPFTKYLKTFDVEILSKGGSSLSKSFSDDIEQQLKDHHEKLRRGFEESITNGGYVLIYNNNSELLGTAKTVLEYQNLIDSIDTKDFIHVFVNPDGYIVGTDIKVEL